jgi:hypothetical protein
MQNPTYITLGSIRANGVQTLAAWCLGRGCNHFRVLDVSRYLDEKRP